jgi:hypothetical protein
MGQAYCAGRLTECLLIRKKKYNYTLDLVSGATGTASTTAKYF